jgi:hypothetical protein
MTSYVFGYFYLFNLAFLWLCLESLGAGHMKLGLAGMDLSVRRLDISELDLFFSAFGLFLLHIGYGHFLLF